MVLTLCSRPFARASGVEEVYGVCRGLNKHLQPPPRDQALCVTRQALPISALAAGVISSTVILASLEKKKKCGHQGREEAKTLYRRYLLGKDFSIQTHNDQPIDFYQSALFLRVNPQGNKIELQSVFFDTSLLPTVIHLELESNYL